MRKSLVAIIASAIVFALFMTGADSVQARPQYLKAFTGQYPALKAAATKKKCGVCHPEKKKKVRNAYGKAMGAKVGKKNQKDKDALKKALLEAEKAKGKDGKTFGEQLKGEKLPE
ncbi:MAG: hypothetical protein ABGZ17_16980 [Planctomycetaceae bacterium]